MSAPVSEAVVWHDVECGAYAADLPLWRSLADAAGGPVLDVGAGTGRVALDLGRHGHDVTAIDVDADLVRALSERADGLSVRALQADARRLDLGADFALCVVPMQTMQLFGPADRHTVLVALHRHLRAGGVLAAALADPLDGFDPGAAGDLLPTPDLREIDGVVYASQPVAIRPGPASTAIERVRRRVTTAGTLVESTDVVELYHLTAGAFEREGARAGLTPGARRRIPPTDEHVGSRVVVLRAATGSRPARS